MVFNVFYISLRLFKASENCPEVSEKSGKSQGIF